MRAELTDAVLDRLGVERPSVDLDGLSTLYLAWCRNVPFDNLRKRIWLAGDPHSDPPPGADADDFFEAFLAHGTGGTCWSSSGALTELLAALGFDARRVASSMVPFPEITHRPNHGTTIVRLGDEQWMVDSSMLTEAPLPLVAGAESTGGAGINAARIEPLGSLWKVWWKSWRAGPAEMPCELEDDAVDADLYRARYLASIEASPFNAVTYSRKCHPDGLRIVTGDVLVEVDRDGERVETAMGERRNDVLVSVFGYSEEIVAAVPDDQPGPRPQVPSPG